MDHQAMSCDAPSAFLAVGQGIPAAAGLSLHEPASLLHAKDQLAQDASRKQPQQRPAAAGEDNRSARFYKERRYLLLEFPELCQQHPPQVIAEIGCGCGSSILPVLKANPTCRAVVTDVSPSAVEMVTAAAARAGIQQDRIQASVLDASVPPAEDSHLAPSGPYADCLMIVFTLAALPPSSMSAMLSHAFQALKPGGKLLIRDHGLFDLTHLRLTAESRRGRRLYSRQDGTLCYVFSCEDLAMKATAAGFEVIESSYVRTKLLNRKTGQAMKRVFVHGVFRRRMG
ncbi:hypothetical protein WJX84_000812 [Apatococcus fuscideae]|uniref:Methyltransferase-like protein n=1 Tax=Apatococcus fuscideae TaxID=2026836 RepID=A0AAW1T7N0_9CHLO